MSEDPRAAACADVCDEQRLIHAASGAFAQAATLDALDAAWRRHVAPVETALAAETLDLLQRLRDLRRATLAFA